MGKRKHPKNYLEHSIGEIQNVIDNIHRRLSGVEYALSYYIDMRKDKKKFDKFVKKKVASKQAGEQAGREEQLPPQEKETNTTQS